MATIAVDAALLREVLLPGLTLTPGRAVAARVVAAANGRGTLSIAGFLIEAELPRGVRSGDTLRLEVRDVDPRRVLLGIAGGETGDAPPPNAVALPGGAVLAVLEDEADDDDGGGSGPGEQHRLSLRLTIGSLGTVDLRFSLGPATLALEASLAPGDPLTRAREAAAELGGALADAAGRPASVTITPRREPLDVYA